MTKQEAERTFIEAIGQAFNLTPSKETLLQLSWALSRVGKDNGGDLVAAVVLSCFEAQTATAKLADSDLQRAVWRVVKAITRHGEKEADLDPSRLHQPRQIAPLEQAVQRDSAAYLMRIIASWPEFDQALFLASLDGKKSAEMSEETGLSRTAIRQRLSRMRKQLREGLSDEVRQ